MNFHPATGERREFLKMSAASLALPATAAPAAEGSAGAATKAVPPLNILILGGTGFTGPDQVRYALARGHKVTLLNRNSRPAMFAGQVEQLVGDLGGDLSVLKGRSFDVVIDNPTTLPAWVRNAAQYLKGNTKHYIFISTISTYRDNSQPNADETAATLPLPEGLDPYTLAPENAGRYYGPLKAFAEKEVAAQYPGIATVIRPGLIVGPLDQSDRFTYWPVRMSRGGKVMAPGTAKDPTQYIDARDIAEWTIRMAEQRAFGTYNAMGPAKPLTMGELLDGIRASVNPRAELVWVPADFLEQHKIGAWINMPVWVPPTGDTAGFMRRSNAAAVAKGLTFRPLPLTAAETLAWHKTRPAEEQARIETGARAGISAAREAEVLAAWAASGRS